MPLKRFRVVGLGNFLKVLESPLAGVGAGVLFVIKVERRTPEWFIPQLVAEPEKEKLAMERMPVIREKNAAVILHDI